MTRPGCRPQGGFTLLESVVTLVIVSMLMAMLMQTLGQSLQLRTRLLRLQGEAREMLLHEAWFRESVAAAQPPSPREPADAFEGGEDGLSYLTAAPLVARGTARVRWWLDEGESGILSLYYSDPTAGSMVVVPGPLEDAGFAYLAEGTDAWVALWDSTLAAGDGSQREPAGGVLPRLGRFRAVTPQGRRLDWLVHLPADLRATDRIDVSEGGANGL